MKRIVLFIGLILWTFSFSFAAPRYLFQTGHTGPITALAFHTALEAVVSAGKDGFIKVWNAHGFVLQDSKRIAADAVTLLALHPSKPRFAAVFEQDGVFRLTAYDWSECREIFSMSFPKKPLFVDFSPRGTYLAACIEDWNSLSLFNAETGEPISFPAAGSGIASFAAFSAKETTIMTYHPSGKIVYWEIGSAKKITEIKTQTGYLPITLSGNKRFLVCSNREKIILLDTVSGRQNGVVEAPGLLQSHGDRQGAALVTLRRTTGGKIALSLFTISENALEESFTSSLTSESPVTALATAGGVVFTGNSIGEVHRVVRSGAERVVRNTILAIDGLAAYADKLVLVGPERLLVFKSDFFLTSGSIPTIPSSVSYGNFSPPFPGNRTGIFFHGKDGLYVWKRDIAPGVLSLIDPDTFVLKSHTAAFSSSLRMVSIGESYYCAIDDAGICRVNGLRNSTPAFEFQTSGLNTAAFIPPHFILFGKSGLSSYESSLALVTMETGETTFLQESASMVFDLAYDVRNKHLYYLGVERIGATTTTVLKIRRQDLRTTPMPILSKPGRFLFSSIALDPERGRLYFSFEDTFIRAWDGSAVQEYEEAGRPVRKIVAAGNTIYALHDDSSVTAWDASSRTIRFHLLAFENGSWILITRDGRSCRGGGDINRYVRLIEPGAEAEALWESLRLDVRVTNYGKDSL